MIWLHVGECEVILHMDKCVCASHALMCWEMSMCVKLSNIKQVTSFTQ